ncbi:MAG: hypothetical protein EBS65_07685 [Betaproteobacteria bacterium]|nr:hypothetical protein [Betaproteobacteria bacterium]
MPSWRTPRGAHWRPPECASCSIKARQSLRYQQNLSSRRIAIVVLSTPSWPRVQRASAEVASAVDAASSGSYVEVRIP